jgi:coenzyme F420-0:L-glutamate ligase/coenzyme F420-1:gamma-L-glutamate ligase
MKKVELIPLGGIPKVKPGDDIPSLIIKAIKRKKIVLNRTDLIVVAHKIISIAENRFVDLSSIKATKKAKLLSQKTGKSDELCQLILDNSKRVIKSKKGLIIAENNLGVITANAGIDQSNINKKDSAVLLPLNPNISAKRISKEIHKETKKDIGIIVSDSIGRPWRYGLTQIAIGSYGVSPIRKYKKDIYKNPLYDTDVAIIDEISSAAGLLMEKDIGVPVVLIRGYNYQRSIRTPSILLRSDKNDIFK